MHIAMAMLTNSEVILNKESLSNMGSTLISP
jgi:hypothetical protein